VRRTGSVKPRCTGGVTPDAGPVGAADLTTSGAGLDLDEVSPASLDISISWGASRWVSSWEVNKLGCPCKSGRAAGCARRAACACCSARNVLYRVFISFIPFITESPKLIGSVSCPACVCVFTSFIILSITFNA
jgi:hypothetical protein